MRKTKLTPERATKICGLLAAGNVIETSCRASGIVPRTYYYWVERGRAELERVENGEVRKVRKKEQPFVDFYQATEKALVEAETKLVKLIMDDAMAGGVESAKWMLPRRFPDNWARTRLELSGLDGGPIEVRSVLDMSDDELLAIAAQGTKD